MAEQTPETRENRRDRKSSVEKAAAKLAGVVSNFAVGPASGGTNVPPLSEKAPPVMVLAGAPQPSGPIGLTAGGLASAPGSDHGVGPTAAPLAGANLRASPRRVTLDLERMRSLGMVTSHADKTQTAEEFRLVKRPLLLKAFDNGAAAIPNGNLIMVASARPGEGKTFCAVSLAMSIALERDLTVLLIDGDVAKPEIPNVMGFDADLGLVDLIGDETLEVSEVLLRTNIDNLTILPAGRPHHLATELLASDRMERFIVDIVKRYGDRVIILDSPPVLANTIASVLALYVGQILFVVEADKTPQASVDSALGLVSACKNISLLLNKARPRTGSEKFGSYYGYYT